MGCIGPGGAFKGAVQARQSNQGALGPTTMPEAVQASKPSGTVQAIILGVALHCGETGTAAQGAVQTESWALGFIDQGSAVQGTVRAPSCASRWIVRP